MASDDELINIFKEKLESIENIQLKIENLSNFVLNNEKLSKKLVDTWYQYTLYVSNHKVLCLIYLANDIIQKSKKNSRKYSQLFKPKLLEVFNHANSILKDNEICNLYKLIDIWKDRKIFDEAFIEEISKVVSYSSSNNLHQNKQIPNNQPFLVAHFDKLYQYAKSIDKLLIESKNLSQIHRDSKVINLIEKYSEVYINDNLSTPEFLNFLIEDEEELENDCSNLDNLLKIDARTIMKLEESKLLCGDLLKSLQDKYENENEILINLNNLHKDSLNHLKSLPKIDELKEKSLDPLPNIHELFSKK